ncbi:uncharacterized protein G2W53_041683 [Senna tora]|uniref:Uncharacterized protein n=1 Tax=Senna tora TaxID=362788 RepID=A0A834SFR7_9FABA|nr:uncharacterized protein G2W53_041683 [Senna tora]
MSVRVVFANQISFDASIGVVLAWEERGSCLNIFRRTNHGRISETFTNYEAKDLLRKVVFMLQLESSWHGRSVDHVLTYSRRQIVVGSQKPLRITRQKTCCASESNTLVRVVFANRSGFDALIGVILAWEERGSCLYIFQTKNHGRISETFTNYEAKDLLSQYLRELRGKRLVAQASQTRRFALYLKTVVVLMLQLQSSWRGRSVDRVLTYSRKQIAVGSQQPSQISRQKNCCASDSNTSVRVVFANRSGFDAPIGVILAWEERGSCLNIFPMTNRGWISETFTNYEAKDLLPKSVEHVLTYSKRQTAVGCQKPSRITRQTTCCASQSNTSVRVVFTNRSGFDAPIGVVLAWEERASCVNIFQTKIAVGSQKPSRITRQKTCFAIVMAWEERGSCLKIFQTTNRYRISEIFTNYEAKKTCCVSESNTSVRVVFANRSGFDAPIAVVMEWEERGSCLNIFQKKNRGRISATFINFEAKDLLRKQKTCCATESNASVRVVFSNRSGFDAPIGVVLACEKRGSCLNIFWTTNRGRISETFTNYEAKDLLCKTVKHVVVMAWEERGSCLNIFRTTNRGWMSETFTNYEAKDLLCKSLDHVLPYSRRQVAVVPQKPSRITRQKTSCASDSNTSVRYVFSNRSGFVAPFGVVLAWEERGSCLNIFQTTNGARISETFTNYEPKDLLRKQKTCCESELNTSICLVFANQSGFDAPIGVVLAWEERGSCLNIFRIKNYGRISETFKNYEAKDLLRKSVDHVLTYSGRQIAVGSQKPFTNYEAKELLGKNLNELQGKRLVAQVSQTSQFALYLRTGMVLLLQLESLWHGRSVDHVLTYSGRQIAVGSQKPSRITRQKTCCATESNTSVRVVFVNRTGFDAPIAVVLAWEERGSCLNIFRTTNRGQFALYLQTGVVLMFQLESSWHGTSVDRVLQYSGRQIAVGSQKIPRITRQKTCCAIVMAWEERGSFLNIFWTTNRGRISETFTNYEAKDLLRNQTRWFALCLRTGVVLMLQLESSWHGRSVDHVLTYSRRQIAVRSQQPSRISRQKTCCASDSNTSVRVVFANQSGFDAPFGVVLAWVERGSCLNILWTKNCDRISETFTNYEAKHLLRNESNTSVRVVLANRSGFDARIGVVLASEERGSCLNIFRTTNRGRISETFTNYEAKDLLLTLFAVVHAVQRERFGGSRRRSPLPIATVLLVVVPLACPCSKRIRLWV